MRSGGGGWWLLVLASRDQIEMVVWTGMPVPGTRGWRRRADVGWELVRQTGMSHFATVLW
jgi:hypothetical protein